MRAGGIVLLAAAALAAAASLEGIPTDSWVYDDIELLRVSGWIRTLPSTSRPWTRAEAARLVREADSLAQGASLGRAQRVALARLVTAFAEELPGTAPATGPRLPLLRLAIPGTAGDEVRGDLFSRAGAGDGRQAASIGAVIANRPGDPFAFYERAEFTMFHPDTVDITDSAGTHVFGTRVHSWMQLATLEVEHAYLAFRIPWVRLQVGRDKMVWGPGATSSVMLDDNAPSLDNIRLSGRYGNVRFLAFTSYLSRWGESHRFLSAQRLELSLLRRLVLGGALMAVYSWDSLQTRSLFGLMNPLIPVYVEVANSGHDDNFLAGGDFALYLPQVKLHGQFFLDNFEFLKREWKAPNAIAWQVGVHWVTDFGFDLLSEYARVNPFTYYHRISRIMYEHYGVPLGHELGPDADRIYARAGFVVARPLTVRAGLSHTRRGYYNRGDFSRRSFYAGQPLPRGFPSAEGGEFVERTVLGWLELELRLGRDLRLAGSGSYRYTENRAGTPENEDAFGTSLRVEYRYD